MENAGIVQIKSQKQTCVNKEFTCMDNILEDTALTYKLTTTGLLSCLLSCMTNCTKFHLCFVLVLQFMLL